MAEGKGGSSSGNICDLCDHSCRRALHVRRPIFRRWRRDKKVDVNVNARQPRPEKPCPENRPDETKRRRLSRPCALRVSIIAIVIVNADDCRIRAMLLLSLNHRQGAFQIFNFATLSLVIHPFDYPLKGVGTNPVFNFR